MQSYKDFLSWQSFVPQNELKPLEYLAAPLCSDGEISQKLGIGRVGVFC